MRIFLLPAAMLDATCNRVLQNTLAIPIAVASFFICCHVVHHIAHVVYFGRRFPGDTALESYEEPLGGEIPSMGERPHLEAINARVKHHEGWAIAAFLLLRVTGCTLLFCLSCLSVTRNLAKHDLSSLRALFHDPELWMAVTYFYSTTLAVLTILSPPWSTLTASYNTAILLVTLSVYSYRDLWPLATYTESPQDDIYNLTFGIKLTTLFICAIGVPLLIPHKYVSMGAKNTMPTVAAEQTCSWVDRLLYGYISPVVDLSRRVNRVSVDDMPPLLDSDKASVLRTYAFKHLDSFSGAKRRHIFFGLLRVFWKEYTVMCASLGITAITTFCSPTGIYRLLDYLERGPGHDTIRPWFWIFFIFAGSLVTTVAFQNYIYYAMRLQAHMEALLTQLIFEHSLRIRVTAGNKPDASLSEDETATEDSMPKNTSVSEPKNQASLTARISNLLTTDLATIGAAKEFSFLLIEVPIQTTLAIIFLYKVLGTSALAGVAVATLLLPLPKYVAGLLQRFQRKRTELMDMRVQEVTEAIDIVRMIKIFGWEKNVLEKIDRARESELVALLKFKILMSWNRMINNLIPTAIMVATYAAYTILLKQNLTASTIFSTLTVFDILRIQFMNISTFSTRAIQGKVSLDRVDEFLKNTELLDTYSKSPESLHSELDSILPDVIGFCNASFTWSSALKAAVATPSSRHFRLNIPGTLKFDRSTINLIVGPTGAGKTSVLMALLGEMHFAASMPDSWFNLDRRGGVAYAAQEPWVKNEKIRDNILFGEPYNDARYKKVLLQCALDQDLALFEAGDQTEIGEKGITLSTTFSGGQKARVSLARTVYSSASVLLLDDIFAALDAHTASFIIKHCFRGDLIKGRTVLIVTHNVALLAGVASKIVEVTIDGAVREQTIPAVFLNRTDLNSATPSAQGVTHEVDHILSGKSQSTDGKLVLEEELVEGRVTWKSFMLFMRAHAGSSAVLYTLLWTSFLVSSQLISVSKNWFLGYWGSQYEGSGASEVRAPFYLSIYTAIVFVSYALSETSYFLFMYGSVRASRAINKLLVNSVLTSTFRKVLWLDVTPVARIISRCTQDIGTIDDPLAEALGIVFSLTVSLVTKLAAVLIFTPLFLLPGIALGVLGFYLGTFFIKAQLSVKREMSNAKSPLLSHVIGAISATVSIRAFGAQEKFRAEAATHIDHYTRLNRTRGSLERWIATRIDLLGNLYFAALACYLVYGTHIGASNSGFSLNMAADFSMLILVWVRFFNDFEVQANSLERIQGYIDIDHEPSWTRSGAPPAAWPKSGHLEVKNLSARYSKTGPPVLHNISFDVKSGERLGIVGRTGSGKSSLTLALLRCIFTEGDVAYDGRNTKDLNLETLRANITVIPQTPESLRGTLRKNLDPFNQFDDAELNDALRAAGLFTLQTESEEGNLTLDSEISPGGGNLSVGEKQILALARALLRQSKILILDEATSAIDHKTDSIIQDALRRTLPSDVTVITVAHRLQTIMDSDRVMVLDAGRIVEHDAPATLLAKNGGIFKSLVDASNDAGMMFHNALTMHAAEEAPNTD